jgi:hypothetical protein
MSASGTESLGVKNNEEMSILPDKSYFRKLQTDHVRKPLDMVSEQVVSIYETFDRRRGLFEKEADSLGREATTHGSYPL